MNENRRIKDVAEYLKEVSETKAKWPNSTLVFRGQENEEWLLDSSAERRLKASLPSQEGITEPFLEYNEALLEKCRLKNYDKREQKQLYDLELLADLQHHGAATCLIDFTRNALVALWFACKKSDANGKVFVVNIAGERFWKIIHTDIEEGSIRKILQFKIKTRNTDQDQAAEHPTPENFATLPNKDFWYWTPAHLNERITAQHSLFLFGLPALEGLKSEEIIVESESKGKILRELEELHDICEESLFPDFVGFAYTQRSDVPYLIPDAEEYFRSGVTARQQGQYSEAIQDFNKAIKLEPDYAKAYYLRAAAYYSKRKHDLAIEDSTKAIELKPDYAKAYLARTAAYYSKGEYDYAIQDSTKAIELNPDYANAYLARGHVYRNLGEYDHAIQDYTKAMELNPDYANAYYFRGLSYSSQGEHDYAIANFTKAIKLNPKLAEAYYARALACFGLERWQNAKSDLVIAKNTGLDIITSFHRSYKSVADFEQRTGIKLPEDIAAMLTKSEN